MQALDMAMGGWPYRLLYFDPDGSSRPRFRLVYRYTPSEMAAVAIEALAVGRRAELDAYRRAIANLARPTP